MKRSKIKSVRCLGREKVYSVSMKHDPHNYFIFDKNKNSGVVSLNSHAVAYTYISSMLLYLKAHYPLEFFTAILSCEADDKKLKAYKLEAERCGVTVNKLDLNKSGVTFQIVDDSIYIGFSNVKGIGKEIAKKIVEAQPYTSFEDFLTRFGTSANILKPLISLGTFEEATREQLYEYYEYYKIVNDKKSQRLKRNLETRRKIKGEIISILPEEVVNDFKHDVVDLMLESYDSFEAHYPDLEHKDIYKLLNKYKKSVETFESKSDKNDLIKLADYEFVGDIELKLKDLFAMPIEMAEAQFYGFAWRHPLEKSPDYEAGTGFYQFDLEEDLLIASVQVQVVAPPIKKQSKKGVTYYVVALEDDNWQKQNVTFWEEDFNRFKEELEHWESEVNKGHFMKIRVKRPEGNFNYTFDSPPKHLRWKIIPKEKQLDYRLLLMRKNNEIGN